MKDYQLRVVEEQKDLNEKISKLSAFIGGEIFPTLGQGEQTLLSQQLTAMSVYSDILGRRIALFKEQGPQ